jgi:hypothetical protein
MPKQGQEGEHQRLHGELLEKKRLLDSELVLRFAMQIDGFDRVRGYESLGYTSIIKYCKDELHLGPSTARYYLQIARFLRENGSLVPWEDWVKLGPTKIRVLATQDDPVRRLRNLVKRYASESISTRQMEVELRPNRVARHRPA